MSQLSAINRHNQQLFDHFGGAQQNRWGYGEAERLGGLEVHGHLELGRKLHREVARFLAAQDAIDIGGGANSSLDSAARRHHGRSWRGRSGSKCR